MKKSFNAYGQAAENVGGSIPVWCGVVSPIPYGAVLDAAYVTEGAFYKAGTPVEYNAATRTYKPMKNAEDATVTPNGYLYNDVYIGALGQNDAATGAIVMNHAEGLLIGNTEFADIADELATKIPGVHLVRPMTA
jgi:hypothetical protein